MSAFQSPTQQDALAVLRKRLEETSIPEFPRHRLRMLSKLSEGAFGTVNIIKYCKTATLTHYFLGIHCGS